jgi:cysteinyl-tRNA synthetase
MFPHHECEIAQSEALTGKTFCDHWVHTRWLQVNGEKMSKSSGNFYTVRGLIEKGIDPLAIRYALISGVYGKPYNFTDQGLIDAGGNVERLRRALTASDAALVSGSDGPDELGAVLEPIYEGALDAMCDDLNTSAALAKALEGAKVINRDSEAMSKASAASARDFLHKINALLGIVTSDYDLPAESSEAGPDEARIDGLIEERNAAKKAKNFARADEIRKLLTDEGIELRDTPEGTTWTRKPTL